MRPFFLLTLILVINVSCFNLETKHSGKFNDNDSKSIIDLRSEINFHIEPIHQITIPDNTTSNKLPNQQWIDWGSIIEEISITPLQNNSKGMIGAPSKIIIHDSLAYILDSEKSKMLLAFNKHTGSFIRTIGNVGKANNEYISPHDFFVSNDSLIGIYDHFGRKIVFYDYNGLFKKSTKLNMIAMNMVNVANDTVLWCSSHNNHHLPEIDDYDLLKIGLDGKIYNGLSHNMGYMNYHSLNILKSYKKGIAYHNAYSGKILYVEDTVCSTLLAINFEKNGLPEDFAKQSEWNMENFIKLYRNTHSYVTNCTLTDDYVLIDYTNRRLPYKLLFDLRQNRIVANGLNGVDCSSNIEPLIQHYVLSGLSECTATGNTLWGVIPSIHFETITEKSELAKYNLTEVMIKNNDYFLVKLKMQ